MILPVATSRRASPARSTGGARALPARGMLLLLLLALMAIAAPVLTPYDPTEQLGLITLRSQPPSFAHPFGTDSYSRDVLSRVLHGGRVSLRFALSAVLLGLLVGTSYGALTAFAGPTWSRLLRRALDVVIAVPRVLVLLAVSAMYGQLDLAGLVLLVGFTGWFTTARQVADELDALRRREFTLAARAAGVRTRRIVTGHLLPHLLPLLVINGTFAVANTIGLEAGLSYLGLGIQPPAASWGTILRDGAGVVETEWWLTLFPGLATVLAVLACNVAGDALRDRFASAHVAEP